MQPFQARVIEEVADLDAKLVKLTAFVKTPEFDQLPQPERLRLSRQRIYMRLYAGVLNERIAAFT